MYNTDIQFEDKEKDLGTVVGGTKTEVFFSYKDGKDYSDNISAMKSSCGCTTPTKEESGISVIYKSPNIKKGKTKNINQVVRVYPYKEKREGVRKASRNPMILKIHAKVINE